MNASLDEVSSSEINVDVSKKCSAGVVTIYSDISGKFDSTSNFYVVHSLLQKKFDFFSYNDNFNALEKKYK